MLHFDKIPEVVIGDFNIDNSAESARKAFAVNVFIHTDIRNFSMNEINIILSNPENIFIGRPFTTLKVNGMPLSGIPFLISSLILIFNVSFLSLELSRA